MGIYISKKHTISQFQHLMWCFVLFSIKFKVLNDLHIIALCLYLQLAQRPNFFGYEVNRSTQSKKKKKAFKVLFIPIRK